jgi:hypothetical protein
LLRSEGEWFHMKPLDVTNTKKNITEVTTGKYYDNTNRSKVYKTDWTQQSP